MTNLCFLNYWFHPLLYTSNSSSLFCSSIFAYLRCSRISLSSLNMSIGCPEILSLSSHFFFCTNDYSFYYSSSLIRWSSQQKLQDWRLETSLRLTSDLTVMSGWGRRNLVFLNSSHNQFLQLSARHSLQETYHVISNNTQLSPSSLIILLPSSTLNFNWNPHLSSY